MAWKEYFVYGINFTSLNAGSGVVYTSDVLRVDSDSDFELQKMTYWATNGNIRLRIRDDSSGRYIIKNSVDLRNIASNFIGVPFIFPRPYQFLAGSTVTVEVSDASGLANSLRLYFQGAKIRPGDPPWGIFDSVQRKLIWKKYKSLMPFVYGTELRPIAANSNTYTRIEVDNDAHFLVMKITGFSTGPCLIEFKEGARGRDWQNIPVHSSSFLGNGQFPNVLYSERFIYRGSVISINVQDLSGSSNNVEINLIGVKLYE